MAAFCGLRVDRSLMLSPYQSLEFLSLSFFWSVLAYLIFFLNSGQPWMVPSKLCNFLSLNRRARKATDLFFFLHYATLHWLPTKFNVLCRPWGYNNKPRRQNTLLWILYVVEDVVIVLTQSKHKIATLPVMKKEIHVIQENMENWTKSRQGMRLELSSTGG